MKINMTSKDGVTLLTQGKYCTENIEVTPTFETGGGGSGSTVEEKDINFYDYDGTLLHSWTLDELATATELPPLPEQDGLICQGWNWTLEDLKAENSEMDVGAMYITDDGKTRLYITIPYNNYNYTIYGNQSVPNGLIVNWGDGTTETVSNFYLLTHTFSKSGNYVITFEPLSDNIFQFGINNFFLNSGNTGDARANLLTKVEIGKNFRIYNQFLRNSPNLKTITIPNTVLLTDDTLKAFLYETNVQCMIVPNIPIAKFTALSYMRGLKVVSLPNSISTLQSCSFCQNLKRLTLPKNIKLGNAAINNFALMSIKVRNTDIGSNAFAYNSYTSIYDFSKYTSIPAIGLNCFKSINSTTKIVVPDTLYDEWIVETTWSEYASHIVKASEYTE